MYILAFMYVWNLNETIYFTMLMRILDASLKQFLCINRIKINNSHSLKIIINLNLYNWKPENIHNFN